MAISTRQRRYTAVAAGAAIIIGAGALFLQTYPHLNPADKIRAYFQKDVEEKSELSESTYVVPESSVDEWSVEDLKKFLEQKEVVPPAGASTEQLVALVKSLS